MFVTTKTFDLPKDTTEELAVLAAALECIRNDDYHGANAVLVKRRDALTANPALRNYDQQREAA